MVSLICSLTDVGLILRVSFCLCLLKHQFADERTLRLRKISDIATSDAAADHELALDITAIRILFFSEVYAVTLFAILASVGKLL